MQLELNFMSLVYFTLPQEECYHLAHCIDMIDLNTIDTKFIQSPMQLFVPPLSKRFMQALYIPID